MNKSTNRFSRDRFGGGDAGERLACAALTAHKARLTPGTLVRIYRGRSEGMTGTVESGRAPGVNTVYVDDGEGLHWIVEIQNLEVV